MSEENPAVANAPAETTTPTTSAPEATPASAPEQPAQPAATVPAESASYFTKEQLSEMETFFRNNGGYEKVFGATKKAISSPQATTAPEAPQATSAPQTVQAPTQAPEAPQSASQSFREGSYSLEEIATQQYFERLAADPAYANIADEIRKGQVLEGLKSFNIEPVSNGRVNDADIRRYLDLYAATKPAVQTSVTPENTGRVDYYNVADEKAMTYEQATQIQLQNVRLKAAGQPLHPMTARADEVVRQHFSANKK